ADRLAVRAPEWIARAFRATKRPWIDRGQRPHPQRRPGLRIRDEGDVSAVGRHREFDLRLRELRALGRKNWKLDERGRRQRHATTIEQQRSTPRQGERGGDDPAETLAGEIPQARRCSGGGSRR